MKTFEIKGKEHELKLDLQSVKYLNGREEGGAFAFIAKAIQGDIDTFIDILYAGLFHTKEGYKKKDIVDAVDTGIAEESIDLDYINSTSYGVVADSFFYKKAVNKMFATDPEAKKQIETLMR